MWTAPEYRFYVVASINGVDLKSLVGRPEGESWFDWRGELVTVGDVDQSLEEFVEKANRGSFIRSNKEINKLRIRAEKELAQLREGPQQKLRIVEIEPNEPWPTVGWAFRRGAPTKYAFNGKEHPLDAKPCNVLKVLVDDRQPCNAAGLIRKLEDCFGWTIAKKTLENYVSRLQVELQDRLEMKDGIKPITKDEVGKMRLHESLRPSNISP